MFEAIDKTIFYCVNRGLNTPFLDLLAVILSEIGDGLIYFAVSFILLFSKKRELKALGLIMVAGLAISFYAISTIKMLAGRPRPFMVLPDVRLLVGERSMSFPSGHASMAFAMATMLTAYFRKYAAAFYSLAAAIAISRLYLGVHYPSDILAGAALGCLIGWFLTNTVKKMEELT